MSRRAAHSKSQWRSCLLILFHVVMFSFRWKKLPVISVFDILHAVSFNHSGLRRLLAWLGAEQTSAQHWTFCTDWIMAFLKSFKLGNSLDICLVTMQWRMFVIFTSCHRVAAVNLKHLFGLTVVTSPNATQHFSSGQTWTQVSSSLQSVLGNRSIISFKKWFLSKPQKLSSVLSKEQFVRYWQNMSLNIQNNLLTLSTECEESFVARYFSRHLRNTIHRCLWY